MVASHEDFVVTLVRIPIHKRVPPCSHKKLRRTYPPFQAEQSTGSFTQNCAKKLRPVIESQLFEMREPLNLREEGLHVAVEEVAGDAFGDDGLVAFEGVEVAVSHLGGDFEADVEELADVGVVAGVALVVR